jgi:hypothetical protein
MPIALLEPNQRYALVGKTGSGKTRLAMVLAGSWAWVLPAPWQVWWIDTKNVKEDIYALREWGFRNVASQADRDPATGGLKNALYFYVESKDKDGNDVDTVDQVQAILRAAFDRGHVIVVVDEYVQAVPSPRSAGKALLDIFQRGRGRNVGIIGLTQEPVFVPRQLISQAAHICLLSVSYQYDTDYLKKICKIYVSPNKSVSAGGPGDTYGFFWSWIDGSGEWSYYRNQLEWYQDLMVRQPQLDIGLPR